MKSKKFKMIMGISFIVLLITGIGLIIELGGKNKLKGNTESYENGDYKKAILAGGCFWCMEHPFEELEGVIDVISGYTGGDTVNPTYAQVSGGKTGHLEAVMVVFDPEIISYSEILDVFWMQIDPTDSGGQFVDRGSQYATAIFYNDEQQKKTAEQSREEQENSGRFENKIVTPILKAKEFYRAEEHHQDYYKKNPLRYNSYRNGSGREDYLDEVWGENREAEDGGADMKNEYEDFEKPGNEELRELLNPLQYIVTQEDGTERAFDNEYWDNERAGIYVDLVSGEPLFSSTDKYKSGTGWPSFTKPIAGKYVVEKTDDTLFMTRTEVRSRYGDSHLGHVFNDGPEPTSLRYCMNSAALRFIPVEEMQAEGYGEFLYLFK